MAAFEIQHVLSVHHWNDTLFSFKVPDGALTSRLQRLRVGDPVLVGTLVMSDLRPGRHLYLFATGTGLAPFMSIVRDPETYERFGRVVLVHGVRESSELAYADLIERELLRDTRAALDALGFRVSPGLGKPGDYLIERAFVER